MRLLFNRVASWVVQRIGRPGPSSELVASDADHLIKFHGDLAYDEARKRIREETLGQVLNSNRPSGHWALVRKEIARRTSKPVGIDTATRYLP
jgi:hypothetical protein